MGSKRFKGFQYSDPATGRLSFFNLQELPIPQNISPIIWNNATAPPAALLSKTERHFFDYVNCAMTMPIEEKSLVKDFAVFLLGMFDYDTGLRIVRTRREMPFCMCATHVSARIDVAVIEHNPLSQYTLLVQEDKRSLTGDQPEGPLIAGAIAAFHQNSSTRQAYHLPPLESQTFPAITMAGTAAMFYKITITQDLLLAVQGGQYPANPTIVHRFIPPVPDRTGYPSKDMASLENRRVLLQCFEAFKQFF
ncbi:hypothetical protein BD779DRAFT_504771 [Infundibulicybe gibba]|nr:hypothetical protein BD779DRAFT_504771 [Infundibulicybe gibba]